MRTKAISKLGRSARNLSGRARKKEGRRDGEKEGGRQVWREGRKLTEVPDDKITTKIE